MPTKFFLNPDTQFIKSLAKSEPEFRLLRQKLHSMPELSREEFKTAELIESLLQSWGIETERISTTGVIGVIKKGSTPEAKSIGLRADIDALPITEANEISYASQNPGVMHACGHDGHTTMLLLAAKYLALEAQFNGTVVLIFQPDEEDTAGARRMIEDGLFEKYPVDNVFAIHNFPGAPQGKVLIKPGPQMAGTCAIDIAVHSPGGHAAHPYQTVDSVLVASQIVVSLQSIVARNISGLDSAVITIGAINGGSANNVIPDKVTMKGTLRYFDLDVLATAKNRIEAIATGIAESYGATATVTLTDGYIPTINHDKETMLATETIQSIIKPEYIRHDKVPSMGAEDFGFMLHEKPGAYFYIGNDRNEEFVGLHTAEYDFNDDNILVGGAIWAKLAIDYLQ